jgi:hypothetical protein
VLNDEALVVGADGCELDAGALVVGELVAGAVGFGALGRPLPFPFPCALALTTSAITRPVPRAAARGNERLVTMAVPLDGRSKGRE